MIYTGTNIALASRAIQATIRAEDARRFQSALIEALDIESLLSDPRIASLPRCASHGCLMECGGYTAYCRECASESDTISRLVAGEMGGC